MSEDAKCIILVESCKDLGYGFTQIETTVKEVGSSTMLAHQNYDPSASRLSWNGRALPITYIKPVVKIAHWAGAC